MWSTYDEQGEAVGPDYDVEETFGLMQKLPGGFGWG